jgi:ribosomal protein S13
VHTAKVFDMLLALPKVGRVKATKIMNNCHVSPNKTLGSLSDRQRAELAERLNQ